VSYQDFTFRCRVAYPHLHTPHAFQETDEPQFRASLVVAQDDEIVDKLAAATKELVDTELDGNMPNEQNLPLKVDSSNENLAGCYVIRAKSKQRPRLVNRDLSPIMDPAKPGDGDWVYASIRLFSYSVRGSNGVSAALNGIMWESKGEQQLGKGGPPSAESMFGDYVEKPTEAKNPFA
jgi:hypothetical protein